MDRFDFTTATPESAGIPSKAVTKFIRGLREHQLCMHSVLILRNGKILAEGYAPPFNKDRKHRMYSISKSFTSLGIGLMADEGKLKLTDRIISFYPEYAPGPVHPFIAEATIRDMLTMRDCHDYTLSSLADWFSVPPTHPSGTIFRYNTTCTNLLCGIIEKLSGTTLMEYLYPRLLGPIGFSPDCKCIMGTWGHSWSGSGIICTPRDLARVALLCMNGGKWEGNQLISKKYIDEATGKQTDNTLDTEDFETMQGYGYQIWQTRHNGFAFIGMGSQFAIALPEKDLLLITTADTQGIISGSNLIKRLFWDNVFDAVSNNALPEDVTSQTELAETLNSMELTKANGMGSSPAASQIGGKTFRLFDNNCGWTDARFEFENGGGRLIYTNNRGMKEIPFGFGSPINFTFPETHYPGMDMLKPRGSGYEAYASAGWADDRTLNILCYITDDYVGNLRICAVFDENRVTFLLKKAAEHFFEDYEGWMYGYY